MKKDFFKKLYPLTKLYLALALIISAFIIPSHIYDYSMIIICGIIVSFENKLKIYSKRIFLSLFWLFTAIFIIQSLFIPAGEVWLKFGFISVYKEGVMKAIGLTSKLTAIVSALTMLTLITPVKDFTLALEKKGLNPKAAFILMLTLQTIPEMKKQADVIMDSQKARGIETEGNVFVMGDNRTNSADSRYHMADQYQGTIPEKNIVGKVVAIALPLGRMGLVDDPDIQH